MSLSFLPLASTELWLAVTGVALAYVVFGIAGFGTALVAGPVLAHVMPVAQVVPLLALLDCAAAGLAVARQRHSADRAELRRLVPLMALGSLVGAALVLLGRPQALLLALGIFAVAYAAYALSGLKPAVRFTPRAALPFGLIGGVFSAMFGSGGFLYAIYLGGRLEDAQALRVTQSTLIGLSTLTRVLLFMLAGVYADASLLALAALLVPAMLLGSTLGRRMTQRVSRAQFMRLVHGVVLCSGAVLLARAALG